MQDNHYPCHQKTMPAMPRGDDPVWEAAPAAWLSETETGQVPFLATQVQFLRDDKAGMLYVRFSGEDDEVQSTFRLHDAPVYRADVMELFIADTNDLGCYKELEVTPYDVRFDGVIRFTQDQGRTLNMDYDISGWKTSTKIGNNRLVSVWALPYTAFDNPPETGVSWRINAFRIDHHSARGMSLMAWQPTLKPNFHVPDVFGFLDFVD